MPQRPSARAVGGLTLGLLLGLLVGWLGGLLRAPVSPPEPAYRGAPDPLGQRP